MMTLSVLWIKKAEAIATSAEVIGLMKADQFNLVKCTSYSQGVLEPDPSSHRLSAGKEFDSNGTHRVLGLCRLPDSDMFRIKICLTHLCMPH